MKLHPIRALLIGSALVASTTPADAAVRSARFDLPAPTTEPSLDPDPDRFVFPYVSSVTIGYDDAGSVSMQAAFRGARSQFSRDPSVRAILTDSCAYSQDQLRVTVSASNDDGYVSRSGYGGSIDGQRTSTGDGALYTFSAPGLAGLDLRCIEIETDGLPPQKTSGYFEGFAPKLLTADNATQEFNALLEQRFGPAWTTADERWSLCPSQQIYDPADDYEPDPDAQISAVCQAQFRKGSTWRTASGSITQGEFAPELTGRLFIYSWQRRWKKNPASCLRGLAKGTAESNDGDCHGLLISDVAYSLRRGKVPRSVYTHGTNTAGFDRAERYRCKRKGRTIECRNSFGDGFRFRPAR
ncbi:MAG: hypothetical protein Q7T73_22485 [Beijerinckiaceae bacterium]|nr:hypothetical protein [Beijerinckiaceae bacterium]